MSGPRPDPAAARAAWKAQHRAERARGRERQRGLKHTPPGWRERTGEGLFALAMVAGLAAPTAWLFLNYGLPTAFWLYTALRRMH